MLSEISGGVQADGGHLVAVTTHVLPAAVQMAASLTGLLELDENFEASLEGSDGRNGAKTERRNRSGVDEDKDRDSADDGEGTGADNGSIAEEIEGSDGSGEVDRTAEGVAAMKGTAEGVVAMKGTAEGVAAVKGTAEGVAAVKGMPELKRSKSPVRREECENGDLPAIYYHCSVLYTLCSSACFIFILFIFLIIC